MEKKELVSIKVLKAVINPTNSLKKLIDQMNELDQGKIDKQTFEKARDTLECSICGEVINKSVEENRIICHECQKEEQIKEKEERQYNDLKEKWNILLNDLNEADEMGENSYVLHEIEQKYGSNTFKIDRKKNDIELTIYRDEIFSGSGYHARVSGHALRISTNDYDINANRLKKDFNAKNIARSLHKKCNELISKIQTKKDRIIEKKNKKALTFQNIIDSFDINETDIDNVWVRGGFRRRGYSSDQKGFKYKNITVKTYDGIKFTVGFVGDDFNAEQIKKIVEFKNKQNKELNSFVKEPQNL